MKLTDVIDKRLWAETGEGTVLGIDIGSRTAKASLVKEDEIFLLQIPTGINTEQTVQELFEEITDEAGISRKDISYIVGTGYGRVSLRFEDIPFRIVTEIACHAMGAHYLDSEVQTLVDIGGQDSKSIRIDPKTGKVIEFTMNDKCAAGTGRFLEKVASLLDLGLDELGEKSLQSKTPCPINSTCVVFAESEIISLRAKGHSTEDIAAGVHYANARRIKTLLSRLNIVPNVFFSGGVSNNIGMKTAIEEAIGYAIKKPPVDAIFAGALGAAIIARKDQGILQRRGQKISLQGAVGAELDYLENRIKQRREFFATDKREKKAGYLCSYTPLELLSAAGTHHLRLYQAGTSDEVSSGELVTRSVFCDLTKSIIGKFKLKDPVYANLDRVYTFYTCECMKKTAEAINELYKPSTVYVLPRMMERESSRKRYLDEILHFKEDLETLSGRKIKEEDVAEQIKLYNHARRLLVAISELRKRPNPPLTGREFLDLARGYYYIPVDELIPLYKSAYNKLAAVPDEGQRPVRLMLSGGIIADGDHKLMNLAEDLLGARIVIEDHCTGVKTASIQARETGNPYEALAEAYLDQFPCTRMKPIENRINLSVQSALDYQVEGVLYAYLKFCPCYGQIKNQFLRQYQAAGIPVLELPFDFSPSDEGQIRTRLEAFVEVLNDIRAAPADDGALNVFREEAWEIQR
jgi:predicted CoA-substrate-specific enzyme activase